MDYIKTDKNGIINTDDLISKIRDDTKLISVMLVNNEIGTIQPVKNVCNIAGGICNTCSYGCGSCIWTYTC